MSHFSVLCILTPEAYKADPETALRALLIPYKEYQCGDEDPPGFREQFCKFNEDADSDPDKDAGGKCGYWRNPNQKWDWYQIGGRFDGALGFTRTTFLGDWQPPARHPQGWTPETFWIEYQKWSNDRVESRVEGAKKPDDVWRDMRIVDALISMGAATLSNPSAEKRDDRLSFADVTPETLRTTYAWFFLVSTYAVLDDKDWHAPGKMGWWGCSDDTIETRKAWKQGYQKFVTEGRDPKSLLVLVDCHI